MFINTSVPRAIWHGLPIPDAFDFDLDGKLARILLHRQLAVSNMNGFGASSGLRPGSQAVISDEPWFQNGDHDLPLDGSYSGCLSGVNAMPPVPTPACAPYVSHQTPRGYKASSPSFLPKRISDGDSFWTSSPTANSFCSSTNSPINWNSFQSINDPFGFNEHIHGLPGMSHANAHFIPSGVHMSSSFLDLPLHSPTPACGSFSSAGAIDLMESMVLKEESTHNSWSSNMCGSDLLARTFAVDSPPWAGNIKADNTVSPKLLRIHPTPTPASSCDSLHTSFFAGGDSDSAIMPCEPPQLSPAQGAAQRHHHDSSQNLDAPSPSRYTPTTPDDRSEDQEKPRTASRPGPSTKTKASRSKTHRKQQTGSLPVPPPSSTDDRAAKDEYLVKSKLAGMTYKEIRRKGGFSEAESTLRGRFRTLTKNKEARVRKPEWADIDDRLLKKAVRKFAKGDPAGVKTPWKQVAEYIVNHGGSYHFGNTTCRKRWDTLMAEDTAGRRM